jgi:hypothetical protein
MKINRIIFFLVFIIIASYNCTNRKNVKEEIVFDEKTLNEIKALNESIDSLRIINNIKCSPIIKIKKLDSADSEKNNQNE